jgi:sulfite reductase (NADPH) hemoprotein beta-component
MGMTHGSEETYPRLADIIGFCRPDQVIEVAEKVVLVQRDFGDRTNRKHARLKYTIDDRSPEWFLGKVNEYLGYDLEPARPFHFEDNGDRFGWVADHEANFHLNLFIEGGRVRGKAREGLRRIAEVHEGDFRLTGNQNLIIARVTPEKRPEIEALLEEYGLLDSHEKSALRLNSIACVALPTCGLALAEAERALPGVITDLENVIEDAGLRHDAITIRMTGCPNGCGRPFLAEIAFVGRTPGKYNLYLGGGHAGDRLNKLYREAVTREEAIALLEPIIRDYAVSRNEGEHFGDFVIRAGYVAATVNGLDFHANLKPEATPA